MIKKQLLSIVWSLSFFVSYLLFHNPVLAGEPPLPSISTICSAAQNKTLSVQWFEYTYSNRKLAQEIIIDGIKVISDGRLLKAYTNPNGPDDVVSVQQLDYGVVTGIFRDRGGNIIAIGDQTSYRVKIKASSGKAKFYELEELPTLWRDQCGILGLLFGSCQVSDVYFSNEIRAAFVSGFDTWGFKRSYAFGLDANTVRELSLPDGATPVYLLDVPGSGQALFKDGRDNPFYAFDGERFQACND